MAAPVQGTIGILPAGALGVSFFYHLTRQLEHIDGSVFFLERSGSSSAATLRKAGELRVADARKLHHVPIQQILKEDFVSCYDTVLPEVLLVCPNPDQLLSVISECVCLLETAYERGELDLLPFPIVVLCSNGIYFQRIRQILLEKLEEATLLGRLPDLWPDIMPRIIGRLLRGISIQTGLREGSGAEAIYRPGPRGITRLAGGDSANRERACALLASRGGWFELAANSSATRLEFDKAMVNLSTNLLGQLYAIDDEGHFRPLTLIEIIVPEHEAQIRNLCRHVFEVGLAVKAYASADNFETLFEQLRETLTLHESHIPSSLQWVGLRIRTGMLEPKLTPTEEWLLEPLIRYARSAALESAIRYFEQLKERVIAKLRLACERYIKSPAAWEI
jgi:hypothetical protein